MTRNGFFGEECVQGVFFCGKISTVYRMFTKNFALGVDKRGEMGYIISGG